MSNDIKEAEDAATATASAMDETNLDQSVEAMDEEQSSTEMDFGAILEQFEQEQTSFSAGELVQGKVVGVSERGVLIDFGYKSEGIAGLEEFTSPDGEITVKSGDEVEVIIRSMDSGDNPPHLSRLDALRRRAWNEIETAFKDETPITGRVIGKTKGGLRIDINGVEAFLPGSQVDSRPIRNLDPYVGQDMEVKVIKFSRKRNNIVLSRKVLTDEVVNAQKAETLESLEEGYIIEGKVKSLTEYGAFVDLGGIDGLLHVTDMSWGRLQNPNQLFKINDTVQVKVLKLDRSKEKVSLGYKQLLPDPWSTVGEVYPVNSKTKGKVSSVTDYGAFIELEPGVEGLVHVSEMSWSKRAKHPKNLVRVGDEVEVQVLGIDTQDRRISLGMKQLMPNPWESIGSRYQVGTKVQGRVRNLTDFGAFIEVEDGVDGLVHVSDISWSKKLKNPKDALKKGQEVEAVVTSIDIDGRRLSLSIKDLSPSAWDAFVATHRPGDLVKGKISRFANFGVFVELGDELEGLCHISELSDERVDKPEQVVSLGQEMEFKILRIENDVQKIGLSARAVGKEDEPEIDTKVYSTEAKGGMASLAELANLKFGREPEPVKEEIKEEPKAEVVTEEVKEEVAEAATEEVAETSSEATAEESSEAVTETVEEEAEKASE
ncbi:MAG TPA: 30S ribosomal protein S1 [Pyrinomonadaceae bacterium]|nr:30S ribosomal protein S1 [Pyrinomonadaceae bacterium]